MDVVSALAAARAEQVRRERARVNCWCGAASTGSARIINLCRSLWRADEDCPCGSDVIVIARKYIGVREGGGTEVLGYGGPDGIIPMDALPPAFTYHGYGGGEDQCPN